MDYAGDIIGEDVANTIYTAFLVLCMLAAVIGVGLLSKKGKEEYDLVEETPENENSKATLKEKLVWLFKTPAIIIAIVLFVGEACLFLLEL